MNQPDASTQAKLYLAGTGMVTPLGRNTATTFASVNAGISAYTVSDYYNKHFVPITVTAIPAGVFNETEIDISQGEAGRRARINKMASIAVHEACSAHDIKKPVPLVLAMPENDAENTSGLIQSLVKNCQPFISVPSSRSIHSGRASGMEAIAFAFDYLYNTPNDFILIGGSDSYLDDHRLSALIAQDRLLSESGTDGFAPGEAAGFLLLTRNPELALQRDGFVIAINPPGIAEEIGHLHSEAPYRGDGLDQAFKGALSHYHGKNIHSIFSSMNGENHWAKEYGVAFLRSRTAFQTSVKLEHPADCYGDLGSASAPVLIALAAEHLFKHARANAHLVYSSSDTAKRGALVLEKIALIDLTGAANKNSKSLEREYI